MTDEKSRWRVGKIWNSTDPREGAAQNRKRLRTSKRRERKGAEEEFTPPVWNISRGEGEGKKQRPVTLN